MKMHLPHRHAALVLLATASASLATRAQTEPAAPPVAELAPVTVAATRDPAMLPYAQINAVLHGFEQHGQGLFRMDFKLGAKDPRKPRVAPALSLRLDDTERSIPIAPDGRFSLPMLPAQDARRAELASNQPKGSLTLSGTVWLTTPPPALDIATVRRIVATAGRLRSELLPWYARWLFPKVDAVRVCSRRAAWSMQWPEGGRLVAIALPLDPGLHDEIDPDDEVATRRVCTSLSGQENWPETARLVADPDTTLGVQWNR